MDELQIEFVDSFCNSAGTFGAVFAEFRECHDRCGSKAADLDRLAVKLRALSNTGVTLVEKASSECENILLLCENVGKQEEQELRQLALQSLSDARQGFKSMAEHCQQYMFDLESTRPSRVIFADEVRSTQEALAEASRRVQTEPAASRDSSTQASRDASGPTFQSAMSAIKALFCFLRSYWWGLEQNSETELPVFVELQPRQNETEQMMLIDELEKARNNAIRNNEIVEHLITTNERLVQSTRLACIDLEAYFSTTYEFCEQKLSKRNASKKSEEVRKMKELLAKYYKDMLVVTSEHNFSLII